MVERLAPSAVLVYGSAEARVFARLSTRTEFVSYPSPTSSSRIRPGAVRRAGQGVLFEVG